MSPEIYQWFADHNHGEIVSTDDISTNRGCTYGRLELSTGESIFMKYNPKAPDAMYQAEAEGLQALDTIPDVRVPKVLHACPNFILLEDIGDSRLDNDTFFKRAAHGVARLHAAEQECFGWHRDSFCGPTLQINTRSDNGFDFFAEHRILHLAAIAFNEGYLNRKIIHQLEHIAAKLPSLVPDQPPVLLHGDLWTGNVHCAANGDPVLIDPACYWGWAETDLAMTKLFGGYQDDFYETYLECSNIDKDWEERMSIYNLYHLLNHLLLSGVGSTYELQIDNICRYYARK